MAEEKPQDAAYSDEEFGSEHEYQASDNEFDEDTEVDTTPVGMDNHIADDEKDAEYDGEFDEDDAIVAANPLSLTINESTITNAEMTENGSQENTALYDGEFDEDDVKVDAVSPGFVSNETTAVDMTPLDDGNESPKSPNDQTDANDDNDTEYSNGLEHDTPAATSENTSLLRNPCEETGTQRNQLSSDCQSNAKVDSTPKVLPEKWMDTTPQELSPERYDQQRKPSVCLPIKDDLKQQNLVDDENHSDETNNAMNSVPNITTSPSRAQSYQNLFQNEIAVARALTSVEKITTGDEADPEHNEEGDDAYSDDEGSYGEDSHTSFESEHDNDEVEPSISAATRSIDSESHPATSITGDLTSNTPMLVPFTSTTPGERILPVKNSTSDPKSLLNCEDDYTDELEDEFPSDSKTPQFEGEDTPYNSGDEAGDVTGTLHQESQTLPDLQQNVTEIDEQTPNEQNGIPPDTSTSAEIQIQKDTNLQNKEKAENYASPYDDDEFGDADASNQETLQEKITKDYDGFDQYEFDDDEVENHNLAASLLPHEESRETDMEQATNSSMPETVAATEDTQPIGEMMCPENDEVITAHEATTVLPLNALGEVNAKGSPTQPTETLQPDNISSITIAVDQDQKSVSIRLKGSPEQNRPDKEQVISQSARPKRPVLKSSPLKQPPQATKPSRPPTKRVAPVPPLTSSSSSAYVQQPATAPRPYRNTVTPDTTTTTEPNPIDSSGETSTPNPSPKRRASPSKTKQKVSSPRIPSSTCSDPYQYLSNDPQLPRKEPVPRQKVSSNPSSKGEHGSKRRQLQPVRTPANLRFNLPKMDKIKRDWLFANMFRHGDDMRKYEVFVPSTFLAKPPTSYSQESTKRPLSAHHVYGTPPTARFVSPSRKLVPQSSLDIQDRERNWVATTPHDSKLPSYDSILDKYCTAVTNPMVQRQIYQTRDRDLTPQLAFVLEKRVEKSCRKGLYASFGGVHSYKTEIVPASPSNSTRQRQISPHPQTKSGMLAIEH